MFKGRNVSDNSDGVFLCSPGMLGGWHKWYYIYDYSKEGVDAYVHNARFSVLHFFGVQFYFKLVGVSNQIFKSSFK